MTRQWKGCAPASHASMKLIFWLGLGYGLSSPKNNFNSWANHLILHFSLGSGIRYLKIWSHTVLLRITEVMLVVQVQLYQNWKVDSCSFHTVLKLCKSIEYSTRTANLKFCIFSLILQFLLQFSLKKQAFTIQNNQDSRHGIEYSNMSHISSKWVIFKTNHWTLN